MNTVKQNRFVAGYHEAGHAVMHKLLNVPMMGASIADSGGGKCSAEYDISSYDKQERAARKVMILFAGRLAEEIFISPELSAGVPRDNGFESDAGQILALSATYGGAEPAGWAIKLHGKARALMLSNLQHVIAVASELLRHGFSLPQFGCVTL